MKYKQQDINKKKFWRRKIRLLDNCKDKLKSLTKKFSN